MLKTKPTTLKQEKEFRGEKYLLQVSNYWVQIPGFYNTILCAYVHVKNFPPLIKNCENNNNKKNCEGNML